MGAAVPFRPLNSPEKAKKAGMLNGKATPNQAIIFLRHCSFSLNYFEQYEVHLLPQNKTNKPTFCVVGKSIICQGWVNTIQSRAGNYSVHPKTEVQQHMRKMTTTSMDS